MIRPPKVEDMGLIIKTFIERVYGGNKWLKEHCSEENFWRLYRVVIEGLFRIPGVGAWVLALRDDPDTIIGYLVHSQVPVNAPPVVHWIYVKHSFRGFGLAKRMLDHAGIALESVAIYTHTTDKIRRRPPEKWELQPYLFF